MVNIEVDIKDKESKEILGRINKRVSDLLPAAKIIGETVLTSIQKNFEKGGRPEWKKLADSTIQQRKKEGKWPGQILQRTRELLRAIIYKAAPSHVIISAHKKYAALQHFGAGKGSFGTFEANIKDHIRKSKSGKIVKVKSHTKRMKLPWGDIPARPYMMIQNDDWEEIKEALNEYIFQ